MTPVLTDEQRQQGVAKAARVKAERAEVRRRIQGHRLTVQQALLLEQAQMMPVVTLLQAAPGIGPMKAAGILRHLRISESKRVRGLGPKQLANLIALLDAREAR